MKTTTIFIVLLFSLVFCISRSFASDSDRVKRIDYRTLPIDSFLTTYLADCLEGSQFHYNKIYVQLDSNIFVSNNNYGIRCLEKTKKLPHQKMLKKKYYLEGLRLETTISNDTTSFSVSVACSYKERKGHIIIDEGVFHFSIYQVKNKLDFYLDGGMSPRFLGTAYQKNDD